MGLINWERAGGGSRTPSVRRDVLAVADKETERQRLEAFGLGIGILDGLLCFVRFVMEKEQADCHCWLLGNNTRT